MQMRRLATLAAVGGMLLLPGRLSAHGGQYRGPGDTVPPNPGGGGGRTGGPGGPTTPTPGGPTTPTPGGPTTPTPTPPGTGGPTGGPGPGRGPVTQTGGAALVDDLSQWQFWWEFNKDPFLNLKKAIHSGAVVSGGDDFELGRGRRKEASSTLAPSLKDKKFAAEALKWALEDKDSNRDIISSCMVALAKIGLDKDILPLFKAHLPDKDQEQSETAAVAMGIANLPEAVPDLLELAKDSPTGRQMVGNNRVPFRTRSFACYGLGLIAYASKDHDLKRKIFEAMRALVEDPSFSNRDIKVAALNAIRLLRPDPDSEAGKALIKDAVEFLTAYMVKKKENQQIQSHAVTALAALVGRGDKNDPKGTIRAQVLEILTGKKRYQPWMYQSAVLALGEMATPEDEKICKALQDYFRRGRDQQAQNFAAIALGQIGGEKNRDFLVTSLRKKRTKSISKPWLALGIAVEEFNRRQKDPNYVGSVAARETILREFKAMKNNLFAAGLAVAMGILRYTDAGPDILDRMIRYKNQDEPAGYFALALGLMGYKEAIRDIKALVDRSTRRVTLLTQGSIALGLLGDKTIGRDLIRKMTGTARVVAVQSALAQALGFIGDKTSIRPLVEILKDKTQKNIPRAFAAVALGLVCDKEEFPWNSKIAVGANYRANTETLTGSGTGILDIL